MKLCQLIALSNGHKARARRSVTDLYQLLQRAPLLSGISRTYRPKDDEGDPLPPESQQVQTHASEVLESTKRVLTALWDDIGSLDRTNQTAVADIVCGGSTLAHNVPVTHLLYLEKQLVDLATLVDSIPVLDSAETWEYNQSADCWATHPTETTRTKKVPRNHVRAEATKEHPAQVEVFTEDVVVGYWETTKFSGAVPRSEKVAIQRRIVKVQDAVKVAREEANAINVDDYEQSAEIIHYIFGDSAASD